MRSTSTSLIPDSGAINQFNLKSQVFFDNDRTKIDSEIRSMYNIKECKVIANDISQTLTSKSVIVGSNFEIKTESTHENSEDGRFSDQSDLFSDVSNSCGSDWEEEYLCKSRKSKKRLERIKEVNTINVNNTTKKTDSKCSSQKLNKPFSKGTQSLAFLQDKNRKNPKDITFQLKLPSTTKINNFTMTFIPQNEIANVIGSQRESGKGFQKKVVTFCNIQTVDTCASGEIITRTKLKNKTNTFPNSTPKEKKSVQSNKFRTILPKPTIVPSGSVSAPIVPLSAVTTDLTILPKPTIVPSGSVSAPIVPLSAAVITDLTILPKPTIVPSGSVSAPIVPLSAVITDLTILPKPTIVPSGSVSAPIVPLSAVITDLTILPKPTIVPSGSVSAPIVPSSAAVTTESDNEGEFSEERSIPYLYHCNKCDKFFEVVDQYLNHKKSTVCGGFRRKAKYQCDICGKCLTGQQKLEEHQNSHRNARPFKCSECDKRFNSKSARYTHHQKMHLNKTVKSHYLCCFCGYITPSRAHLAAHENEHQLPEGTEAPKPFKCAVCGKQFISRHLEVRHRNLHQLKKCTKCPEKFKNDTQLNHHMESAHDIFKIYDCKVCGTKLRSKQTLKHHHRECHTNVLAFTCEICDKGFKRKTNLKQHMITHSDERPLSCSECGDSFKRITHLKQHVAAIHGGGRK